MRLTCSEFFKLKQANNSSIDHKTAYRSLNWDYEVKFFASRESMAKLVCKQQEKPSHWTNWTPLVPLKDNEGF